MAQIRNYQKGVYETKSLAKIAQVTDSTNTFLQFDGILTNAFSNLVLYADDGGASPLPLTSYASTTTDDTATALEAETSTGGSGYTVYSQFKVTDATYQNIDLYATFTNFGTYTDNDALYQIANRLGEMADFPFSVTDSDLQDLFSTYGKYAVYCNGATIDKSTNPMYENLVDMLKNEANGNIAHPFYAADDNQATLPDARGRVMRALDPSGTIDPDGASRDLGNLQSDAFQGHRHAVGRNVSANDYSGDLQDDSIGLSGSSGSAFGIEEASRSDAFQMVAHQEYANETDGTPRTGSETRMSNLAVNKIIFYV